MRVAVIGAGIVGVTTAHALATDGHRVAVFEQRSSVAEETSFANAGMLAPGCVTPWAAPGMPARRLQQWLGPHATARLARPWAPGQWGWMWRWWRACRAPVFAANRARLYRLAHYSRLQLLALQEALQLDFEQSRGVLVLLRTPRDLALARPGLSLMADLGVDMHLLDGARARQVEPGLNPDTPLHAALHLPNDGVGNCRQFAHLLRAQAQRLGVDFRFQRQVLAVEPGAVPSVRHQGTAAGTQSNSAANVEPFDAVVVCAALGAHGLLRPLGLTLPLVAVHGCSITAPLRLLEGQPERGPRSAVMDERHQVAISRLGQRVRVAGGAELGGRLGAPGPDALRTLYKLLDDWFPGSTATAQAQAWKGARPTLPDGPPVLGASGAPGVWLNLGHGASGWALACGSARVVADQLAGRRPDIDTEGLDIARLRLGG